MYVPANPWTDCEEMQLEPIVILIKQKVWGIMLGLLLSWLTLGKSLHLFTPHL